MILVPSYVASKISQPSLAVSHIDTCLNSSGIRAYTSLLFESHSANISLVQVKIYIGVTTLATAVDGVVQPFFTHTKLFYP